MKFFIVLSIVLIILIIITIIVEIKNFKEFVHVLDNNNVMICGLRGTGKDLLLSNYCAYTKRSNQYISNVDYKINDKEFLPIDFKSLDICNDYSNFLNHNIKHYEYKYSDKVPIIISDASLYFPSAYESNLKKEYKGIVNFMPLSRQLGDTQVLINTQVPSQLWDKLRNQCDKYIMCMSCSVLFHKFCFVNIRYYEKYDSFNARIPPYRAPTGLGINKNGGKATIDTHKISYQASYGVIKKRTLFFIHKSNYDSRFLKEVLKNGK